ncbi:MAG: RNA-binding protein [Verrucomicrobiae bacterium]|nr:RNA-binding protein [Verrucomicrobiae bacterium]
MSTDYRPGARRRSRSRRPQHSQTSSPKKKNPIAKFFSKLFGGQESGNGHTHPSQPRRSEHRSNRYGSERRKPSYRDRAPRSSEAGASPKPSSAANLLEVTSNRLYLGNLSYDVAESDLFDLLSQVAPIRNVEVARERRSNRSKGFGFVEMETVEGAKAVQTKFHGYELMGRSLVISGAKNRSESVSAESSSEV